MKRELRKKYNLPLDDADLAYEILTRCEMGLPMQKLCVMLGLKPSDFHTCWKILGTVMGKYNVKISRWYAGGPTWIVIKQQDSLLHYYNAIRQWGRVQRRKISEKNPLLQQLKEREICTAADVVELTGQSRRNSRKLIKRWAEDGQVEIVEEGRRGRGYSLKFKVV